MNTYKLELKLKSGLLSSLQSDTIYGHFCWRLKERLGVEKLKDFIKLYQSNNPVFTISDGLLKIGDEILFPRPFVFNPPEQKETKIEKIRSIVQNKEDKSRKFITLPELNSFLSSGIVKLNSNKRGNEKKEKEEPIIKEALRVSVQIDRNSFTSSEGNLYSYNPKYIRSDVNFILFIKKHDDKAFDGFNCEEILQETFLIGFGKKKSSGYGQFETIGQFEQFDFFKEPENANAFLTIGNYLPGIEDKVAPIGYNINTKYGKFGEEKALSSNPFKNPIVLLTAGSCFRTDKIKDFYGRVTEKGEISETHNEAVQFCMPFCLNFWHNKEV